MRSARWLIVWFPLFALGCVTSAELTPNSSTASTSIGSESNETITEPAWTHLDAETFARARIEGRIILIDGGAKWCHWCREMEATTYRDPEVRHLLATRFLPVKVDIDAQPDFEARYRDYGWPTTVLMTPEARELGKYKGYLPPSKLLEILRAAASLPSTG